MKQLQPSKRAQSNDLPDQQYELKWTQIIAPL